MHHFTRTSIAAALLSLGSLNAFADTIQTDELDPVVITATRMPQKTLTTLNDVSVITEEDIARSGVNDLPSLLKRATGIEVVSRGNAGSQTSLFIRGTNSNQTVVLIDGVRIASATTGAAAFNHIALNQIERIEIVRGAASSVYGADAIGGVIQIFTKQPEDGSFNANIGAGIGNRNTYEVDGNIAGKVGKLGYQLSASHNQTKGFDAKYLTGSNPDKDGYKNSSVSGSLSYDIAEGHTIIARALQDRGVAEIDALPKGQDYNQTTLRIFSLENQNQLTDNIKSTFLLSRSEDLLKMYSDQDSGLFKSNTGYINTKTNKAQWILNGTSQYINWLAGTEWQKQKLDSNNDYSKNSRTNKAIFAGLDFRKDKFLLESSLRHDNDEYFGNETTGRLALGYRITDNLTARASYGTSFRAPTFNDLYAPLGWGANPNLKAEKGKNTEFGLTYDNQVTSVQLSIFQNNIRNLIQSVEIAEWTYENQNVDKARITGTSLTAKHKLNDNITLNGNVTYQNPKNRTTAEQLIRRSKIFGNLGIDYNVNEQLTLSANQHLHGKSHDMVYGEGQVRLAGYGLTSVSAQYQINPKWQVSLSGDNIFDKKYTTVYGYNTPGASVMLRSRYQF